jgi:hypothetical protein
LGRVRRDVPSTFQIPPREAHDDLGGSRDRARGETDRVARCVRASNRDLGFGVDLSASESERGKPADSISGDSIRHPARRRVKHLKRAYLSQNLIGIIKITIRLTPSSLQLVVSTRPVSSLPDGLSPRFARPRSRRVEVVARMFPGRSRRVDRSPVLLVVPGEAQGRRVRRRGPQAPRGRRSGGGEESETEDPSRETVGAV